MPYLVPVEIRQSGIQGKGVHALTNIPKGTVIWILNCDQYVPAAGCQTQKNIFYTKQQLQKATKEERTRILHFGTYDPFDDRYFELRDGSNFTNHSDNANCLVVYSQSKDYTLTKSIASRDIVKGEELTQNYAKYPFEWAPWVYEMMKSDLPDRIEFEDTFISKGRQGQMI